VPAGWRWHPGRHLAAVRRRHLASLPRYLPRARAEVRPAQREGLLVSYLLPIKPGRIVRLSTAADLAAVPAVLRVDMYKQVGDVMRDRIGSSATTGAVFLCVRDEAEVLSRIQEVADRYVLEIEGEDDAVVAPQA
jgi:hypothetical protein